MMESRNPEIRIPMELWSDILSSFPVKTLLRFRAVSKSFLDLIDHPNFVSLHLRSIPANRHETHLFVLTRGNRFQIHETARGGALIDSLETGFPDSYRFVHGSIDGLVLLSNGAVPYLLIRDELLLWNPSTRKKRWLPSPSWFVECAFHSATLVYDHLRRDYKVLLIQDCIGRHAYTRLGLYSVSKGSWKTLHNGGLFGVSSIRNLHSGVSFSGGTAWVEFHFSEGRLVLFDIGTETARYAALPYRKTTNTFCRYNLFRVDGGRGLGLEADGQAWKLEMEKMTWTSLYKIGTELTQLMFLAERKENGELVISTRRGGSIKVRSYNTKTMEKKDYVEVPGEAHGMGVHVESLVNL